MVMNVTRIENLPPPPGIISSLRAGFDAIASHITAILLPVLLNLLLWLGPRLSLNALFSSIEGDMVSFWKMSGIPANQIQAMLDWYSKTIPSINLFGLLRTLPIGISTLLPLQDASTPLGNPTIWQVSGLSLPIWMLLLPFIGWIGGALYFRNVAWISLADRAASSRMFHAVLQTILISIVCNLLLIMISMPILVILFVAAQISAILANLLVLFIALVSVWVIVPIFFWAHGVFLRRQNVLTSFLSSFQLTRFTLPTSSLFVLTVFLLAYGLNFLWQLPPEDSWMTLLGIFGHSFVTTALLAASFIYYYDMTAWVQVVLEKLRPNNVIKQA